MKLSLLTLAFAVLAFLPQSFAMDDKAHAMSDTSNVKAVIFYSENCGSCKILDPRMKKALNAINKDKIDIVKFDFSSADTIAATKVSAAKLGLNDTLQKYGAKTGFAVLLDANGQEITKFKVDHDTADIASEMAKAIASTS